ncbi:hypothetical protein OESDEN_01192 [Oesophagostomum dentatum]|uniref:Uncharacterized protein n=1 Tax=Oesophagostomum dentatum TaxID=61180 RepID=A0A0B1TRU9_OESDE|nr:hypothetical protein OESDEN_01192 [Oesophagostomum dentatum]
MCGNDMFECKKASTSYAVILPSSYAPLTILTTEASEDLQEMLPTPRATTQSTVPISISSEVQRAFPEVGSFGSYGKAGLAC